MISDGTKISPFQGLDAGVKICYNKVIPSGFREMRLWIQNKNKQNEPKSDF
jgi:hypothetical protein